MPYATKNSIKKYARKALRSDIARADPSLAEDIRVAIEGSCSYVESFSCAREDFEIFTRLQHELECNEQQKSGNDETSSSSSIVEWSKHLKHEDPSFSETFNLVVQSLSEFFDCDVFATRLNFYRDGSDWKPFHHDSHAFGSNGIKEDFTMGASFGASRELAFLHDASSIQFTFPQNNGDVFAFDSEVNAKFKHGIPKISKMKAGPRFSIIAWGRRRRLTSRNSSSRTESDEVNQINELAIPIYNQHLKTACSGALEAKRLAMRSEASLVKNELGVKSYRALRILSHRVQKGEIRVAYYVKSAMALINGDKSQIYRLLKYLPNETLRAEISNELACA